MRTVWMIACALALAGSASAQVEVPIVEPILSPVVSPALGEAGARPFYGLLFDGDDYVRVTHAASGGDFDVGTGSWTIALRFKTVANAATLQRLFTIDNFPTVSLQLYTNGNTRKVGLYLKSTTEASINASATYTAGVWNHLAVVINRAANTATIYLNGTSVGSADISGMGTLTAAVTKVIGASASGAQGYYGSIADVRFWKGTALSVPQVATERANRNPYRVVTITPTWGIAMRPGSGTVVTAEWGHAALTFPGASANPTWRGPDIFTPPTRF